MNGIKLQFDFEDSAGITRRIVFSNPVEVIRARTAAEVSPALASIDRAIELGLYAGGYLAYEAAAGFDDALRTRENSDTDLLWFGLFRAPDPAIDPVWTSDFHFAEGDFDTSEAVYCEMVQTIRDAISQGETYQVNLSARFRSKFTGDPAVLYRRIATACGAKYCALLQTGTLSVTSFSPEMFFCTTGNRIVVRPMKGTSRRGRTVAEDTQLAERLASSPKDQAENVMIVDLMRNDIGRISQPGTVTVTKLFSLEQYPTVWQMTSEVSATLNAHVKLASVFGALFPCGSVTGAPKVTAMRRIAALERSPRGVYCGSIGYAAPGGDAIFNVAIRTAVFNHSDNTVTFGSGGGITWDSNPQAEYEEMRSKSLVLRVNAWQMSLLESILLTNGTFLLLDQHINRLMKSASYFAIAPNWPGIIQQLDDLALQHPEGDWKVRLMLDSDTGLALEAIPLVKFCRLPLQAVLSTHAVDSTDFKLYHKTTDRKIYTEQSKRNPNCDEVLMQNERGELTEFLNGNLVIESAGRLFTPPVTCGLLPGVMREHLISVGQVQECVLYPHNLYTATRVWLINSVRGLVPVDFGRSHEQSNSI